MKAIILAAGQGTRLRPVTERTPKCLTRFAGVPLIDYQIKVLNDVGIEDITVVGGYRVNRLQARDIQVVVNENYMSSNMVASLFCAKEELLQGEDILVVYGDIIYESKVVEAILNSDSPITLVVDKAWQRYWATRMTNPLDDAETLIHNDEGQIIEVGKKPSSLSQIQGQYIGLIKIKSNVVKKLIDAYSKMNKEVRYDGQDFDNMYMTSFLQHLIDNDWNVQGVFVENGWLEFDSLEDLRIYHELSSEGALSRFFDGGFVSRAREGGLCSVGYASEVWRRLLDLMKSGNERYALMLNSVGCKDSFDTKKFLELLICQPFNIYDYQVWDTLDKLCWHVDVIKCVESCYSVSVTESVGAEELDSCCYWLLGMVLVYAAFVYEDIKFLNSGVKAIDKACSGSEEFNAVGVKAIARDVFNIINS